MFGWPSRTVVAALGMLLGSLLGAWLAPGADVQALSLVAGGLAGVVVVSLIERLRGLRIVNWLRNPASEPAPRDAGLFGEMAYRMERALRERDRMLGEEQERLRQFLTAIEASPNGVMLLDQNDQIDWCNSQAADHFGIDPRRDRLQRVTNLVRNPAFVAYLQGGSYDEAMVVVNPLDRRTLSLLVRPYGDGWKLVLSQDITDRERNDSMRSRSRKARSMR
jgi:two-component system, OmpR family, phosphate regulon sensor histidine kinase PhoR